MTADVEFDAAGLIDLFARLKGIPVAKVIRNAARDFVQAALKATPRGRLSKSPYGRVKVGDDYRYFRIDRLTPRELARAKRRRRRDSRLTMPLPMRRGWSKASWIGAFRELGMGRTPTAPRKLPSAVIQRLSTAAAAGDERHPEIRITDDIRFTALAGADQSIVQAGFRLAADRLTREFKRTLKEATRK